MLEIYFHLATIIKWIGSETVNSELLE